MKLRMMLLLAVSSIVVAVIAPGVSLAQGCNVDGQGVPPYNLNVADLTYLIEYLWHDGPPPHDYPNYYESNLDDHLIITINDCVVLGTYLFGQPPGPEPECPPRFGPISTMLSPSHWVEVWPDRLPEGWQEGVLYFSLTTTDIPIICLSLPISITVGGEAPKIEFISLKSTFTDWVYGEGIDGCSSRGNGKVLFSLGNFDHTPLPPQDNTLMAEVHIRVAKRARSYLPIVITWDDECPPTDPTYEQSSHYPFLVEHRSKQDSIIAWEPVLKGGYKPPLCPTLTNWGMLVLLVLLILSGIYVFYQRRRGVVR